MINSFEACCSHAIHLILVVVFPLLKFCLGAPSDAFSFINRVVKFHNPDINPLWRKTCEVKKVALRTRFVKSVENLNTHSHPLPKLGIGDHVFVQNQTGPCPNKWDHSGLVVEAKDHDQYLIKMDGTDQLTLRNRRFLCLYMLPDSAYQQPGTSHNA